MLKTGIVTRNWDEWVERHCSRVRLRHTWDAVVCANAEPTTDKSALYLKALALLDVPASEALAFEDSPSGVRAAKKAGLRCVAIPNEITREAAFDDADLVLRSLADRPHFGIAKVCQKSVSECHMPGRIHVAVAHRHYPRAPREEGEPRLAAAPAEAPSRTGRVRGGEGRG
jgi:hypothetical protein